MNVITTSENGVVDRDTIFHFSQNMNFVYAKYSGGKIRKGFLVGNLNGYDFEFSYCQQQLNGVLDCGISKATFSYIDSKLRMTECFEWASRPGQSGINIFEEVSRSTDM